MATKPKAILSTHDGREASPITKASNVLFEDGRTAQDILNDRQDAMISPVIENSSSMFKVGQGDNVDYSANVVNGAYESMVLKGKTMVNCIQEPSSQDVVLPYEFTEGQYVTINDTKESGALGVELKGQTLVNSILSIDKTLPYTWTSNNITSRTCALRGVFKTGVYALIVEFGEVLLGGVQSSQGVSSVIQVNYTDGTSNAYTRSGLENYSKKRFFTTFTINKEVSTIEFKGIATQYENATTEGYVPPTVTVNKIMIIEYIEGMENWDIPYFTGMASCKMPILHTVGKNLFDGELITGKIEDNGKPNTYVSTMCMSANYTRVQPNTTYNYKWNQEKNSSRVFFYDVNKNFIKKDENAIPPTGGQLTTPSNCYYILFHLAVNTEMDSYTVLITKSSDLTYEPHKSSILSLPEEVVLRSLPNGVCDTFNTRTGVYTQRIWFATFDGTESYSTWEASHIAEEMTGIYTRTKVNNKIVTSENQNGQILCDTLPTTHRNQLASCQYDSVIKGQDYIGFTMKGKTSEEIKQWLSENPTTVYCELKTPIITKINLPSTLKSWNTTTHIYSEIPENTLYPILSHSNPSYPVILKPSTKYSIVANSYSNNHTNSAINFNLGGTTASTVVGNRVTTITTPSTLSNELLTMSGRGNKLNNVMVIEGDVVGDEPYFEGMCDCKSPILSNVGKNLFDNVFTVGGWWNGVADHSPNFMRSVNLTPVKPNTTYAYDSTVKGHRQNANFMAHDADGNFIEYLGFGRTFTTPSNCHYIHLYTENDDSLYAQIEEGAVSTTIEPYKSNILSCNGGKIELTEDMFEEGGIGSYSEHLGKTYEELKSLFPSSLSGKRLTTVGLVKVKPNTSYSINSSDNFAYFVCGFNANKIANGGTDTGYVKSTIFTTSSDTYYIAVIVKKDNDSSISMADFKNNSIEIREIDKTIVLRSLPSGVCDTLNVETRELTQRIGEVVFDGSSDEVMWFNTGWTSGECVACYWNVNAMGLPNKKPNVSNMVCDSFPTATSSIINTGGNVTKEGIWGEAGSSVMYISIKKTKLTELNVTGFRQWASQNPITVQYELATPIVSTIDVQGFPYAYKDGHVQLSSGHDGQSLTPTIEYSLPTNRNGQIRSNQKMVERHQKELDKLQAIVLANLVNSQYNQTLTTLNYELSRV